MTKKRTDKQEAILDGALALISEHGFHGAPISAIAKQACVGAGTIYRFYETKDDLIKDLYIREKQSLVAQMMVGCAGNLSVKENFRRIWHNALRLRTADAVRFSFLEQFYNSPYFAAISQEERAELAASYLGLIKRGLDESVLREMAMPVMSAIIMGPINSLAASISKNEIELTDELTAEAFEACWRGISAP